ncbi:MAG: hypothetical protein O2958_09815 [Gemmatimonadetes bacterium]|nr:hypothetical protein [Gemmatimonadota bacterium]MDA1103289.1 hypothetical protein [Gemmatimonadota bacterium]
MAKNVVASLAAAAVGGVILLGVVRLVERQQTSDEINRLRDALYRARVSAGRCQGSLQTSESSLLVLGITIDSLKNRVDSFEAMDRRGVPAGRYDEYLELFDSYNDSVEVWDGRERRLRTAETSCRATIEEHNALTDSLQALLAEAGIEAAG